MVKQFIMAIKTASVFVISFLVGILFGVLAIRFDIDRFIMEDNSFMDALNFICALLAGVFIHETAHAMWFVIEQVKVKLIAIFWLIILKANGKWHIKIHPNHLTIVGGLTIPDLCVIDDEPTFIHTKKAYAHSLLFAPLFSLFLSAMFAVIFILIVRVKSLHISATVHNFVLYFTVTNFIFFLTSFFKFGSYIGDFPAYSLFKKNKKFAALQISQYQLYSSNWRDTLGKSTWLISSLMSSLEANTRLSSIDVEILDHLIQLHYLGIITLSDSQKKALQKIYRSGITLTMKRTERRDIFYYHLLFFLLDEQLEPKTDLQESYNSCRSELLKNNQIKEYYDNFFEYKFGFADRKDWLLRNLNPNTEYPFFRLFDAASDIEYAIIDQNLLH